MYSTDLAHIHHRGFGAFARAVAPHAAAVLARLPRARLDVVEIGCGDGTLARYLAARGHRVTGYDISPAMIRLARGRAPTARFHVASLTTARLPRCHAIVSLGEVITYVPGGLGAVRAFFGRAHSALRPGGMLIFDFIESADQRTYRLKTMKGSDWSIALSASFDGSTRILTRRMTCVRRIRSRSRSSREIHSIRIYSRREIRAALEECGFRVTMNRSLGRYRLMTGDVAVIALKDRRV
jgi:trans-aconitate methyltransferase